MSGRAVALVARSNLRRQIGSRIVLVVLVAVVTGVVLAGVAGARRSATVLDRFIAATNQPQLGAFVWGLPAADAPSFFEAIDGVDDAASVDSYLVQPTAPGVNQDFTIESSPDGRWGTDIGRVLVREGRLPAEDNADEVALNRVAADALGLHVGDRLDVQSLTPARFWALSHGQGDFVLDGPRIDPLIVGIVVLGDDLQGSKQRSAPLAVASPAFGQRYDGEIAVGGSITALRTSDPTTIDRVRAAIGSFPQSGVGTAGDGWVDTTRSAIDVVTIALVVFAAIALVAGALAIGQTISRQISAGGQSELALRSIGLSRRERAAAAALPVLGPALLGSLIGVLAAGAASGLFPMAIARTAEPDLGVRIDPLVLGIGWLVLAGLLTAWTLISARRADRRAHVHAVGRGRRWMTGGFGSVVAPRLGVHLALDRDPGRSNLPTRSALVGAAAAFMGVAAVLVFAASLDSAMATPASFGWTWSSRPDILGSAEPTAAMSQMARLEELSAVGAVFKSDALVDAVTVPIEAFAAVKGSIAPPVQTGRLPTSRAEVALGTRTLAATGRKVGETVTVGLPGQPSQELLIVGEVMGNQITELPDLGSVAVVTWDAAAELAGVSGIDGLMSSDFTGNVLLTYRPGVDAAALEAQLTADDNLSFPAYSKPTAPGRLLNLGDMRSLLFGIAAFFAAIGTLAVVHLLVLSTRRRAHDFGTLRALGFVRRQLRTTVMFQALTIVAVGIAFGVPLGVAVGRGAWRAAIDGVGMLDVPTTPVPALLALVVVAGLSTVLISLVPGAWAARARPARLLRVE